MEEVMDGFYGSAAFRVFASRQPDHDIEQCRIGPNPSQPLHHPVKADETALLPGLQRLGEVGICGSLVKQPKLNGQRQQRQCRGTAGRHRQQPSRGAAALTLLALAIQLGLLNQAPADPYFAQTLQTWEQGRFIRFHGVVQWLGWIWPYAALLYVVVRLSGREHAESG